MYYFCSFYVAYNFEVLKKTYDFLKGFYKLIIKIKKKQQFCGYLN